MELQQKGGEIRKKEDKVWQKWIVHVWAIDEWREYAHEQVGRGVINSVRVKNMEEENSVSQPIIE